MAYDKPIYVVQANHFDPIWRRCWNRTFDYRGKRFRPYSDLEEKFINIWLENAAKGAVWSEGQAVVFRKYIERNPEKLKTLQKFVKSGEVELTAAGEVIPDTNMPSGETLLRNYVSGQWYFEKTFGVIPTIGWLYDAFGQSAQIPQILRGVGCPSVQRLTYKRVPGDYWKGLDGSVIMVKTMDDLPRAGNCRKIPPCADCNGMGCPTCDNTGLGTLSQITDDDLRSTLAGKFEGEQFTILEIGGEEAIPSPHLVEVIKETRDKLGLDLKFGGYSVIEKRFADLIAKVDDPSIEVSDQVEANPVSTGCYVSRIEIKKVFRRIENLINIAERWATFAHTLGYEYPAEELDSAWQKVIFGAFHDAITSTHVDAAYFEIMDMFDEAEHEIVEIIDNSLGAIESEIKWDEEKDYLMIYNSESWNRTDPITVRLEGLRGLPIVRSECGTDIEVLDAVTQGDCTSITFRPPAVPAFGYTAVEVIPDTAPVDSGIVTHGPGAIENEFYKITVSDHGITSIFDKRISAEIMDTTGYLVNELILEADIGHPWGTMETPSFAERLGRYTTDVKIRTAASMSEIMLTGVYKGSDGNTKLLSWRQSVRLLKGCDNIDFRTNVDWDTSQRRIRIAFPTNIKTDEGYYSIPYGALKRGKYEPDMTEMYAINGDWPAINWVDLYGESENRGYALINEGIPSHKIEDGVIFMSILRSPIDPWCINEPEFYDCPDYDGARDPGPHDFSYRFVPHTGDYRSAGIEKRGREFNVPMIVRTLEVESQGDLGLTHSFMTLDADENVIVTAVKKAEKDESIIVRLAETSGKTGAASVTPAGAGNKTWTVDYLERNATRLKDKLTLTPFRVATVKVELKP